MGDTSPPECCFLETVLAKAAKSGVRVNALAKEMGLESKDILSKLKGEGLDWAHNHMSTLTFGQAETVREWYRSGQLGTGKPASAGAAAADAEEETSDAAHEESSGKARTSARSKGKRRSEEGGDVAVAEPPADGSSTEEAAGEDDEDSSAADEAPPAAVAERHAPERHKVEHPRTPTAPTPAEPPAVKLTPHVVPATPPAA
ncbi:MAG: infB, partial [Phycisphaerales bacterium]|nr:infB [Phycisphaerales bacterium]